MLGVNIVGNGMGNDEQYFQHYKTAWAWCMEHHVEHTQLSYLISESNSFELFELVYW